MPADEQVMTRVRAKYEERADLWARRIGALLDRMRATDERSSAIVVVTADHGTALRDGFIWYGYHPVEEVTRVPLVVFGGTLSATDARHVDTLDITKSLLRFLGVNENFPADGRFLLDADRTRSIPVLTVANDVRTEQFLVIYRDGEKYQFNIHPRSSGEHWTATVQGFGLTSEPHPVPPSSPIWGEVQTALDRFGVASESVPERIRGSLGRQEPMKESRGAASAVH